MSKKLHGKEILGIARISMAILDQLWRVRYPVLSSEPGDVIHLNRESGSGTKKFQQLQMGRPTLGFRSINSRSHLELKQRVLRELEVILVTEAGASGPWLSTVRKMELPVSRVLTTTFPPLEPYAAPYKICYKTSPRREVSVMWEVAVEYAYSGSDTEKRLLSEHYNKQRAMALYQMTNPPASPYLQDVELLVAATTALDMHYGVFSPSTSSMTMSDQTLPEGVTLTALSEFGMDFFAAAFPEIERTNVPVDKEWFPSLLVPPGTAESDPLKSEFHGTISFTAAYKRSSSGGVNMQPDPVSVSPLISVVGAGYDKQLIEIADAQNATVVFVGDQHGALERSGGAHYYLPPSAQTPSIIYEAACKTQQPPAQLDTLRERAVVDVIKVTVNGNSALSAFVTLYARQTHYIKCLINNARLVLELWYYDVEEGKDVRVPAEKTEWSTLQGNGSVSSAGVFTPGSSAPSTVSVIAGRDLGGSRLLYWAVTVIPVPLYSEAETITFFND